MFPSLTARFRAHSKWDEKVNAGGPNRSDEKRAARPGWAGMMAMSAVIAVVAIATQTQHPAASGAQDPPRRDAGHIDGAAERKLLADIKAAREAYLEHADSERLDCEMTLAFRGYGLDLDHGNPKEAGAKLAGLASTPDIAAEIDVWCAIRRDQLEAMSWRPLAEVARAIDADPWRGALRDQFDRPEGEWLPVLRSRATDAPALEKQPLESLILLSSMLALVDDPVTAAAVLRVADRRFPGDFLVCSLQGALYLEGAPDPDPAKALELFTAAIALRPQSAFAHSNRGNALCDQAKLDEAIAEFRDAIRLEPANAGHRLFLAAALLEQKKTEEAIAAAREAAGLKPGDPMIHLGVGSVLEEAGKLDEAIASYRAAIRLKPNGA